MSQANPSRATAFVVENDAFQREMICTLLEESDYDVVQCESAEAAQAVLDKLSPSLVFLMTDVSLAGSMNGIELARIARARNPGLGVIVTSGHAPPEPLPDGVKFWAKPWAALDVLREAELAHASRLRAAG